MKQDLRPILKIEKALYTKLRSAWGPIAAETWAKVQDALLERDYAGAYEAAAQLNARNVARKVREYIKYYLLSAGYFGSKLANTKGKKTAVQSGSYDGLLNRLADQFTLSVEQSVTEAAYQKLVQVIAEAEQREKVEKANPYRDEHGKFTDAAHAVTAGKQWTESPHYHDTPGELTDAWKEMREVGVLSTAWKNLDTGELIAGRSSSLHSHDDLPKGWEKYSWERGYRMRNDDFWTHKDVDFAIEHKGELARKANPYHDEKGRFTNAANATFSESKAGQHLLAGVDDERWKTLINQSLEDFQKNPTPGFEYKPDAWYMAQRSERGNPGKINLGPTFFLQPDPASRVLLLRHEIGHDLMVNFNEDFKDVLEPFRKNKDRPLDATSTWENPFGLAERAEEIVADAYTELWSSTQKDWGWEPGGKYNNLLKRTEEVARRLGLPLPKGKVAKATHPRFVDEFTSFQDEGNKQLQLISSLHTSRLSGWGFTAEADVLGIDRYRISAVLDGRTCDFCAMIGEKEFEVDTGRQHLFDALSTDDPEKLREIHPWPEQTKAEISKYAGMDGGELADLGFDVPPFHPNCRCLMVKVDSEIAGEEIPREYPEDPLPDLAPQEPEAFEAIGAEVTDDDVENWNDYVGVAPADVLSKVTGIPEADLIDQPLGSDRFFKFAEDKSLKMQASGELAGADSEVEVSKVFDPFTKTLYNNYTEFKAAEPALAVEWLRGNYKQSVELAKTLGAEELVVKADGSYGAFAHAKMGFLPASASDWHNLQLAIGDDLAVGGRLHNLWVTLGEAEQGLITTVLEHQDVRGFWALAALAEGEKLLAGRTLMLAYDWQDMDASSLFDAVFS